MANRNTTTCIAITKVWCSSNPSIDRLSNVLVGADRRSIEQATTTDAERFRKRAPSGHVELAIGGEP